MDAVIGTIPQGGNSPLRGPRVVVCIEWNAPADVDADASAYLLNENGKVRDDGDMIFYNQPQGAGGAIRYASAPGAKGAFEVDLDRLPREVTRIVFCVTVDEAAARRQTLGLLGDARISVGLRDASPDVVFAPALAGASEAHPHHPPVLRSRLDRRSRPRPQVRSISARYPSRNQVSRSASKSAAAASVRS